MLYALAALVMLYLVCKCMNRSPSQLMKQTLTGKRIPLPGESSKIVMYGRDSCPYTLKMKSELKNSGLYKKIKYVDVTTPEGAAEFKKTGFDGVPAFKGNGRVAVGFMKSSNLLKKLNM